MLMAAFTFYLVPETASKSLEESHSLFDDDGAGRDRRDRGTDEADPLLLNH